MNMLMFVQPNEDGHRSESILVTTIVLILREILIFLELEISSWVKIKTKILCPQNSILKTQNSILEIIED